MVAKGKRMGRDPLKNAALPWIEDSRGPAETPELKAEVQRGLKRETEKIPSGSSQAQLRPGWTRATFIVREELLEKFKDLAYTERRQKKELMDEILSSYLKGKRTIKRPKTEE